MEKHFKLRNILDLIVSKIKKQDFLVYFRKISILEIEDTTVTFGVVSGFMKNNLEAKFYNVILEATKEEFPKVENIKILLDKDIDIPSNPNVIDCTVFLKNRTKYEKNIKSDKGIVSSSTNIKKINNRYTLQNFIVGPDNQLAYSAAEAVCKKPGKSYNPLYIYGDVGLGKTHVLQAIGNKILTDFKGKKVIYTTADKFITEYVTAVKKRNIDRLREKYREMDVLIIDDVQFLSKKEQTQNELYNIFNLLYDNNKQIVISGDRAPKELTELEPRLTSRFEWGITVDIGTPDFETRLAILQEKAREREFMIPYDVAEFVAANVVTNVRELEGVLNQMIAEYELTGMTPTLTRISAQLKKLSFTTDVLGSTKSNTPKVKIKSYEDIIEAVSKHFGIEPEGVLGTNRKREFAIPRQIAMYLLKTKMHYTYGRIGNIFSGRNHTAVLYSCNKLVKLLKEDSVLLHDINTIRDGIGM
ncbi:chromosomal replication initiator protein DnaA [Candidatus Gracilibacteria bacterium]|nr:MAG: chromosomal replication initiator protein DnaA [Candidatus Gracilibacteria bacterium]PIE85004.1 MAG: chromosomal replication initiator protein DnaA [Candidatus Gracilibacteria bacterium]